MSSRASYFGCAGLSRVHLFRFGRSGINIDWNSRKRSSRDEVKPNNWNYIFIEHGVIQRFNYITNIDAEIKYITAREKVNYEVIQTA